MSPPQLAPLHQDLRPGWPEIIAAGITYAVMYRFGPPLAENAAGDSGVIQGLALAALSGVMGLLAFFAAFAVRLRSWSAFGVKAAPRRWMFIAVGCGLAAIVLTETVSLIVVQLVGTGAGDVQGVYRSAASAGPLALTLQLIFIAVLTPVGEELAFRAVLTNALSRYGHWVSGIVSTLVFAVVHLDLVGTPKLNLVLIPALIVGGINAFLFLKTKSVWPGIIVHAINNGLITLLSLAG
ncbi:CPBP family intramembrane glutamic endopeptidase [Actinoplanes sp. TFC3]|uniref:CPBP family intramembrane glutamic endopeptidase n=1 Tax=Actinoplanes sp. TFC3 TaxID=1710355 RepID=UPI00082A8044|nr:CPBP family intramembrane glutamic endopeptidase [Actinoplanes sp. TFC3]